MPSRQTLIPVGSTRNAGAGDELPLVLQLRNVITLPEFIQSEFSKDTGKGRKFGKLRGVKTLKKHLTPAGTKYTTEHQMDLAESLPIAAAFRELLELKGDRYYWKADYREVFKVAGDELYKTLLTKVKTAKGVNSLGADT